MAIWWLVARCLPIRQ